MRFIRSTMLGGWQTVTDEAAEWGLSRRAALVIALFPVAVMGLLVVAAGLGGVAGHPFKRLFHLLVDEDHVYEWVQFALVAAASVVFALVAAHLHRGGRRALAVLYGLLAFGAFFLAGEEISWGQRIFAWGTPHALAVAYHQEESNLHNIRPIQDTFRALLAIGGLYASAGPVLWRRFAGARGRAATRFLLLPPFCLMAAFFMPFAYKIARFAHPQDSYLTVHFNEGPELCLYFGLLVFALLNLVRLRAGASAQGTLRARLTHADSPRALPTTG